MYRSSACRAGTTDGHNLERVPKTARPTENSNEQSQTRNAGVGTIVAGCFACSLETLIVGILQLLTSAILVGWVWSILWGWELLAVSRSGKVQLQGTNHLGPDALL